MTYRWLSDMDVVLSDAGVAFLEVPYSPADPTGAPSWRSRGRPASTGDFDPQGVLCHHTASPEGCSPATDISVILAGNGDAPGPISQLYIGRDAQLYLIAAGRANHGGRGRRPGVDSGSSCADMNALTLGIEVGNNGVGERWSDAVTELYAATVAALCDGYGWTTNDVYLHATTGPPSGGCNSKIDPAGPWQLEPHLVGSTTWNLETWRTFVDAQRGGDVAPLPPVTHDAYEEGTKMAGTFQVSYDEATGLPDGSVWELIHGKRRNVGADEWYQVLKGVMADRDGNVPEHEPWTPVATVANGWYLKGLPEYDS